MIEGCKIFGVLQSFSQTTASSWALLCCALKLKRQERVKQVISGLDDLVKKNLRLSGQRIDIKALAEKVSEKYNVSIGELRSGSRRRAVVQARRTMSWIGVSLALALAFQENNTNSH